MYGATEKFQSDQHWRDRLQFFEYLHGDNGAGLGASHQTGWTGPVAKFIRLYGFLDAKRAPRPGLMKLFKLLSLLVSGRAASRATNAYAVRKA